MKLAGEAVETERITFVLRNSKKLKNAIFEEPK